MVVVVAVVEGDDDGLFGQALFAGLVVDEVDEILHSDGGISVLFQPRRVVFKGLGGDKVVVDLAGLGGQTVICV